jgi:hypothetical protein
VDGDGETPRGKTAENWSRRDGIRAGAVSGPWRSAPRAGGAAADSPEPEPGFVEPTVVRRSRRRLPVAAWIGFGMVFVVGSVAAALMLRPERGEAPAAIAEPVSEPAPAAAPDPALASVGNVRLRVPAALAEEWRAAIVAAVEAGGIADVQVETLPFPVETSRVGYYLEADRPGAEALARLVAPLVSPGRALPVRDYGKLLDDPEPGRLDLWVSD